MAAIKFETIVIYDEDGPIDVIYGQHNGLLNTLKKHPRWEELSEELYDCLIDSKDITDIDELILIHHTDPDSYHTKIKLFINQEYHRP